VTDIAHLALGVRDPARSLAFYRDVVGLEGGVREADFGFVVTTPKGISFSLIRGEPPESLGEVHFGVALPGEEAVRTRRSELAAMGIREVDWWVEPGFVSLKVADPDGYVVEFFWEGPPEPMEPDTDAGTRRGRG
jgi:catechol 2,3-dioxygenase-like lactoylglutathione lyase family enzyme